MGTDKLKRMAEEAPSEVAGGVAALAAELRAGDWPTADDFLQSFPSARATGARVTVGIGQMHRVEMLVHYGAGFILIEEAGSCDGATRPEKRKRI